MPRVSQEHLDQRRREILAAAQRCFAREGFHRTSMQDVFRESGLSAGAVYRYFPAKADLVAAIADGVIAELNPKLAEFLAGDRLPPLDEVVAELLGFVDGRTGPDGELRIGVQVWAEALRDPALHRLVTARYRGLRAQMTAVVRRARDEGQLPASSDPDEVGRVLFGSVLGYALQRLLLGDVDARSYARGLTALLGTPAAASDRAGDALSGRRRRPAASPTRRPAARRAGA